MEAILLINEPLEVLFKFLKTNTTFFHDSPFLLNKRTINYTDIKSSLYVNITEDLSIKNDYENSELVIIFDKFSSPYFYFIDFNNFELFKEIIKGLPNYCLIENDRGKFYNCEEVGKIKSYELF